MAVDVRDLVEDDLERIAWAGSPTHLAYVKAALSRARAGEVEFLTVVADGKHVALGAADLTAIDGAAKIWMVNTHPDRQSQGFGTSLMQALEARLAERSFDTAVLSVQKDNPRGRVFYERLGWKQTAETTEGWMAEQPDGSVEPFSVECWVMSKHLAG